MSDCGFSKEILHAWLDGEAGEYSDSVGEHLAECQVCAQEVERVRTSGEFLRTLIDDAVGEGFDKTAKILGLGYPGGPALAKLAEKGDKDRFTFPRPMTDRPGLDFSFSGLKTFAKNTFFDFPDEKANIAKAFEVAAIETLTIKCNRALIHTRYKTLEVAGGVSAKL